MTRTPRLGKPLVIGGVLTLMVVALLGPSVLAGRSRVVPTTEPTAIPQAEIDARKGPLGEGFVAPDTPLTPELRRELDIAAERERRAAEQNSLRALHARAQEGQGPSAAPPGLEAALALSTPEFAQRRLLLVISQADGAGGHRFEEAMYSDGVGYVLVFWQDWPEGGGIEDLADGGAQVEYQDGLDIILLERNQPGDSTKLVRVFDGERLLTVHAFNLDFDLDLVRGIAIEAFGELP